MSSRWEVYQERCPCCATKKQRITWGIVCLFFVAVIVITIPLALVGIGPDVKFVSLSIACPQVINPPGYTGQDCWTDAIAQSGGIGLLVQLVVKVESNSFGSGDAKMRANLLDPNNGNKALTVQGEMQSRTHISGNGDCLLTFTASPDGPPEWQDDERMRLYQQNDPSTLAFGAAQIYNSNSNTSATYDVLVDGTVSSKMGPFSHTNKFRWAYTFPAGINMPNVVDP